LRLIAIEKAGMAPYVLQCRFAGERLPTPGNEAIAAGNLLPKRSESGSNMADKPNNLQDVFLNTVRKTKTPVTMFLVNGVKLQGMITWFDNFSVLLRRDGHSQLVYKHAISTVMPASPVQLFDAEKIDESDDD
jgi:host factor-I protein